MSLILLKLQQFFISGIYVCVNCGNELFSSVTKYEHGSPWPAFTKPISENSLRKIPESEIAIKVRNFSIIMISNYMQCLNIGILC